MNREKQIEEIAKYCCFPCLMGNGKCAVDLNYSECYVAQETANHLYTAGYRKTSDVAREIFEEIEKETKNHGITYVQRKIAELKKKYTESEKDNG